MNDENKSRFGFILFFIILISLIVGGYFILNHKEDKNKAINDKASENKKDKKKDFIYYDGIEAISIEQELTFKYPVINLKGIKISDLNKKLKEEAIALKISKVGLDSVDEEKKSTCLYLDDNLYSVRNRDYEIYEYEKYLSLVIKEYTYNCNGNLDDVKFYSYVFDKKEGIYLNTSDLLKEQNVLFSSIQSRVKKKIEGNQVTNEDGSVLINIDDTLNDLNNNSATFINNNGEIATLFVVKTNELNYNDNIVIKKGEI